MAKPTLTAERLRELLTYDPDTGDFAWKKFSGSGRVPGKAGGTRDGGYWQVRIDGRGYLAHRLAWLHTHGVWPRDCIDHVNGVRTDNRITNLREVTGAQNAQNRPLTREGTVSGLVGVSPHQQGGWYSSIMVDGVRHFLGMFATAQAGHEAYLAAKERLHPFRGVR